MDWITSGLAGSAIGAVGDLLGGLFGSSSAEDAASLAFERQKELMAIQNDYNVETMKNKHQWEIADLKAAGINPLLTATQPTGTLSTGSAPSVAMDQRAAMKVQSAGQFQNFLVGMLNAKAANKQADASLITAQANERNSMTNENLANFQMGPEFELKTGLTNSQMDLAIKQAGLAQSQTDLNLLQKDFLPKLYKAQLSEIQNRIAVAWFLAKAQDYNLRTSADASMVSANAHMYQAASYDRFVANAEMLGVHESKLKDALADQAKKTASNIFEDIRYKRREYAAYGEYIESELGHAGKQTGYLVKDILGNGGSSLVPW